MVEKQINIDKINSSTKGRRKGGTFDSPAFSIFLTTLGLPVETPAVEYITILQ